MNAQRSPEESANVNQGRSKPTLHKTLINVFSRLPKTKPKTRSPEGGGKAPKSREEREKTHGKKLTSAHNANSPEVTPSGKDSLPSKTKGNHSVRGAKTEHTLESSDTARYLERGDDHKNSAHNLVVEPSPSKYTNDGKVCTGNTDRESAIIINNSESVIDTAASEANFSSCQLTGHNIPSSDATSAVMASAEGNKSSKIPDHSPDDDASPPIPQKFSTIMSRSEGSAQSPATYPESSGQRLADFEKDPKPDEATFSYHGSVPSRNEQSVQDHQRHVNAAPLHTHSAKTASVQKEQKLTNSPIKNETPENKTTSDNKNVQSQKYTALSNDTTLSKQMPVNKKDEHGPSNTDVSISKVSPVIIIDSPVNKDVLMTTNSQTVTPVSKNSPTTEKHTLTPVKRNTRKDKTTLVNRDTSPNGNTLVNVDTCTTTTIPSNHNTSLSQTPSPNQHTSPGQATLLSQQTSPSQDMSPSQKMSPSQQTSPNQDMSLSQDMFTSQQKSPSQDNSSTQDSLFRSHWLPDSDAADQHEDHRDQKDPDFQEEPLVCYNHDNAAPQRYCHDHDHPVCMECAFELHRTCGDVEGMERAAERKAEEVEMLTDGLMVMRAEWENALAQLSSLHATLAQEKGQTLAEIERLSDEAVKAIRARAADLLEEAKALYANEEAGSAACHERVQHALTSVQEVWSHGDRLLTSGSQAGLLRQFGKLKERCEVLAETDIIDPNDALNRIKLTSTWFDDVRLLPAAKLALEKRPSSPKKNQPLSERGLETFKKISKKKRQSVLPVDMRRETRRTPSPYSRTTARSSRHSIAQSLTSTGSLPSLLSAHSSDGGLDGPQSMFEVFAGVESDKYPFGLGDICVLQPRLTILVTYLTSDILRVFPWRHESPPFVSKPLGCTLCCMTQLTNETVAVTSSNSDLLTFLKVEPPGVHVTQAVSMKRQFRAVTALDYRTVALATDSKKAANNVIVIVRFDSSDYRSYTPLRTIGTRPSSSLPWGKLLAKPLFKVPFSMCTGSEGDIIVSDSERKALLALQQNGDKRFVFQPPKHARMIDTPGGVACSPSGHLFLVDSCEQRILRFDRSGRFQKVALSPEDGLEWPIGVAVVQDNVLCVAEFYGQVKVFRLK